MTLTLTIPKLACAACVKTITEAVTNVDPGATVTADTKTKQVSIETQQAESRMRDALAAVGYPVAA